MEKQLPEEVKQKRLHRLMTLQQGIAQEINQQFLGRELEVLVDESDSEPDVYLGRTFADAPEVDGQVFLKSRRKLTPGEFVRAKVVDTYEYDLVAELV